MAQRDTLKEEGAFLFIKAQNKVSLIKVDKGVISESLQGQLKCDYAIFDGMNKHTKFIELKGEDVEYACNQIHDTVVFFERDADLKDIVDGMSLLKGYIVSPHCNVPDIDNTYRKKVCRKLHGKSRIKLETLFHYLVFIKCITKNPGKNRGRIDDDLNITIDNQNPLLV